MAKSVIEIKIGLPVACGVDAGNGGLGHGVRVACVYPGSAAKIRAPRGFVLGRSAR